MACVTCTFVNPVTKNNEHDNPCYCSCHPKKPNVYRTISHTNSGSFVWEVREVIHVTRAMLKSSYLLPTLDNNHIYAECFHSFSQEIALELLQYEEPMFETVIIGRPHDPEQTKKDDEAVHKLLNCTD